MKWFRFYSEVIHDAKIQTLSLELKWSWISVLCLANEGKPRGTLPPIRDVAFALRVTEAKAKKVVDALIAAGLIDVGPGGEMEPHNWDARQHKSDDAGQVKREQRAKHKPGGQSMDMSMDIPPVSALPTVPLSMDMSMDKSRTVHPRVRADSETDSETEKTPPNPPGGGGRAGDHPGHEDTEPLDQGDTEPPPEPEPAVRNDPSLVKRVAATADRLFPTLDFGAKVFQLQGNYDVAVLEASLIDAHAADRREWRYIAGIYRARMSDGRGAGMARTSAARASPASRPVAAHPVSVAPPDSKFRRVSRDAFRKAEGD